MDISLPLTELQLQAIATSMANCGDPLSQLVRVLQQVRAIRLDDIRLVLRSDRRSDQIVRQILVLDYEICFLIRLTLQEKGIAVEGL